MTRPELGVPSIGYLVWHLSLRWQTELNRALAPLGITHTDYAVMASLLGLTRAGVQPSQRELAGASGVEPMYLSKLVRALERDGLVERRPHAADPRANQLSITSAGESVVAAGRRIVVELEDQRLAALGGAASERSTQFEDALVDLLDQARAPGAPTAPAPGSGGQPAGEKPPKAPKPVKPAKQPKQKKERDR